MTLLRAAAFAAGVGLASPAAAEVVAFEVQGVPAPAFDGRDFGAVGRYERIAARATIALDPANPRNAVIADIALAPRDAQGRVRATAEVVILRPADPARGNGTLLMEAPNRGRELIGQLLNDVPGANLLAGGRDAGNGHLLRQGYSLAWVGWQFDLAPGTGLRLEAPVLAGVTGPSRDEFVFDTTTSPVAATLTYPAARREGATLTVRQSPGDARQAPAGLGFRWLDDRRIEITRPAGFDASALYELIYEAKDPAIAGLAFAATRDVAVFLQREGGAANPLAAGGRPRIDRAILTGISQSGRFVRDYLYLGFNQQEAGQGRVFAAMMPHIAGARRTYTNARFAQPGRNPTPHNDRGYPADQFPFAYEVTEDHLTGARDGLLARCRASATCPRIIQTDSEYEAWGAIASLTVTDTRGNAIALPEEVRAFLLVGHPHFALPTATATKTNRCDLPLNPLHAGAPMRALLAAAEAWMRDGAAPPASRYPSVAEGTLRPAQGLYPAIPGLPYAGAVGTATLLDPASLPPVVRGTYPVLVPAVDPDGNARAGLRMPVIEAPKATYTGWNPRAAGFAPGTTCYNTGGALPLAATRAAREAAGDPRLSVEERYPSPATYVAAVRAAAERLVAARLLLPEDLDRMVAAAEVDSLARLPK